MKKDYLGKILGYLAIISFIGVFISVMTQVITRFLPFSYSWTEEMSRLLFVASVCFAAPVAYRDNEFVIVDFLVGVMPPKLQKFTKIIINLIVIILFAIIFRHGVDFAVNGHRQLSATLKFPMSIPFAMIPLSALFFIYYAIINLYNSVKDLYFKAV